MAERRSVVEFFRDHAVEVFEAHTGSAWRPHTGSRGNHRALTATLIDSRVFLAAKRRSEIEPLMPKGVNFAFAGGVDCNDHRAI